MAVKKKKRRSRAVLAYRAKVLLVLRSHVAAYDGRLRSGPDEITRALNGYVDRLISQVANL